MGMSVGASPYPLPLGPWPKAAGEALVAVDKQRDAGPDSSAKGAQQAVPGIDARNGAGAPDKVGPSAEAGGELTPEARKAVEELKAGDREVRAHEAAHLAAAGGIAVGGASYSYERGPDGQLYAVGGEVSIDTSPVADDPAATVRKAEQIRRAALAPANPSSQDLSVAAAAAQMQAQALAELAQLETAGKTGAYATAASDYVRGAFVNVTA